MKRLGLVFAVVALFALCGVVVSFAQETTEEQTEGIQESQETQEVQEGPMPENAGMISKQDMKRMCDMRDMKGMMHKSSMQVTPDGGVIILMGNKLVKYDKDLNLVKEVMIAVEKPEWKGKHKEGCTCPDCAMKKAGITE